MLSPKKILPVVGLCLFAIGTALPVHSEENARDGDEERVIVDDVADMLNEQDENEVSFRLAEKLAADMNQHLTASEGEKDNDEDLEDDIGADIGHLVSDDINDDEEEDGDSADELVVDNADDAETSDEDEGDNVEDEEIEDEGESQNAAHKDADADRFASDAVKALFGDSDNAESSLESDSEDVQDEVADEVFDEDSDTDMDMMGDFSHDFLGQASRAAVPDEENVRNSDEMVGQPFTPKEE